MIEIRTQLIQSRRHMTSGREGRHAPKARDPGSLVFRLNRRRDDANLRSISVLGALEQI
jgi:hypothetical protein